MKEENNKKRIYCLTQQEFSDFVKGEFPLIINDEDSAIISIIDYQDLDKIKEKGIEEKKHQIEESKYIKNVINSTFDNILDDIDQLNPYIPWKIEKRALTVYEARRLIDFILQNLGKNFYIISDEKEKSNPFKIFIAQFFNWIYDCEENRITKEDKVNPTILYKLKDAYRERTGEFFITDYYQRVESMRSYYMKERKKRIMEIYRLENTTEEKEKMMEKLFGEDWRDNTKIVRKRVIEEIEEEKKNTEKKVAKKKSTKKKKTSHQELMNKLFASWEKSITKSLNG